MICEKEKGGGEAGEKVSKNKFSLLHLLAFTFHVSRFTFHASRFTHHVTHNLSPPFPNPLQQQVNFLPRIKHSGRDAQGIILPNKAHEHLITLR